VNGKFFNLDICSLEQCAMVVTGRVQTSTTIIQPGSWASYCRQTADKAALLFGNLCNTFALILEVGS
jgi:hypothetical protein